MTQPEKDKIPTKVEIINFFDTYNEIIGALVDPEGTSIYWLMKYDRLIVDRIAILNTDLDLTPNSQTEFDVSSPILDGMAIPDPGDHLYFLSKDDPYVYEISLPGVTLNNVYTVSDQGQSDKAYMRSNGPDIYLVKIEDDLRCKI